MGDMGKDASWLVPPKPKAGRKAYLDGQKRRMEKSTVHLNLYSSYGVVWISDKFMFFVWIVSIVSSIQ